MTTAQDASYPVFGVVGGSGGVGASTLAAVLAATAAADCGTGVLVDLDPAGGGIDVLLGLEDEPGARWSGLRLDGGHLEPEVLVHGLVQAGNCAVLAADVEVDLAAVEQVVRTAAQAGPVVRDLPRRACAERDEALGLCRLILLLARGDVPGLVAARTVAAALEPAPVGLVVRRGDVPADDAARLVDAGLLGELPALGALWPGLDLGRPPSVLADIARGVLCGALDPGSDGDATATSRWRQPW